MPRTVVFLASCLALTGSGCNGSRSVVAYQPDRPPEVRPAPDSADYLLLRVAERSGEDERCLTVRPVARRELVGFAHEADGTLVAVAGQYRQAVPEGSYRWRAERRRVADPGAHVAVAGQYLTAALEPVSTAICMVIAPFVLLLGGAGGGWG